MRSQTSKTTAPRRSSRLRPPPPSPSPSPSSPPGSAPDPRPVKRRKTTTTTSAYRALLLSPSPHPSPSPSLPPLRRHPPSYHVPLLLTCAPARAALLSWFDAVRHSRRMPWRDDAPSSFLDPATAPRAALARRAYRVWLSEVMLQQTRVAVAADYFSRWTARWPTVQALAAAAPEDVLAAWRGLGYYARATRLHDAARLVVRDMEHGLLPDDPAELVRIPGVGRYTAGAVASIAFGRPAAMVDGNVQRVLGRQLGLRADVKTDRLAGEMIWDAAQALVDAVALDGEEGGKTLEETRSDRPGRWGQALMELGSTVCVPRPRCGECPVTATCRAYAEGAALSGTKGTEDDEAVVPDVEDLCTLCEPLDEDGQPPATTTRKQATRSSPFFGTAAATPDAQAVIVRHAQRFPVKTPKKPAREEAALVCAVVRADGRLLVRKRPARGLLAGLWEFPSAPLDGPGAAAGAGGRGRLAREFVAGMLPDDGGGERAEHFGELGSVPWAFSHIRLTMHVHLFRVEGTRDVGGPGDGRWSDNVEAESMGTGMRKCWDLVKAAV